MSVPEVTLPDRALFIVTRKRAAGVCVEPGCDLPSAGDYCPRHGGKHDPSLREREGIGPWVPRACVGRAKPGRDCPVDSMPYWGWDDAPDEWENHNMPCESCDLVCDMPDKRIRPGHVYCGCAFVMFQHAIVVEQVGWCNGLGHNGA